ncbi:MAG: hypothetical protein WBP29_02645 [Candidatus Zixiibacteriota bacterium]
MKCRQLNIFLAAIITLIIAPHTGAAEIQLDSKISAVTVYRDCARVTQPPSST